MKYFAIILMVLGVLLAAFMVVFFGAIHADVVWMLHNRYGPPQPQGVSYEHLFHWTMVATQRGIDAENLCGYLSAAYLVSLGVILLAWGRDKKKLRSISRGDGTPTV
jgi:hypothetical protein